MVESPARHVAFQPGQPPGSGGRNTVEESFARKVDNFVSASDTCTLMYAAREQPVTGLVMMLNERNEQAERAWRGPWVVFGPASRSLALRE